MNPELKEILMGGLALLAACGILYFTVYRPRRFRLFAININTGQFVYARILSDKLYLWQLSITTEMSYEEFLEFKGNTETLDVWQDDISSAKFDQLINKAQKIKRDHGATQAET